MKLQKLI